MANEVIKNTVTYTVASGYGAVVKAHVQQMLNHIPGLYIHTTKKDTSSEYDVILAHADFNFGLRVYNSSQTLYIYMLPYAGETEFSATVSTQVASNRVISNNSAATFECVKAGESYWEIRISQGSYALYFALTSFTSRYDNSVRYCMRGSHNNAPAAFVFAEGENICSAYTCGQYSVEDCAPADVLVLTPDYVRSGNLFLGNPLVGGMPIYYAANMFAGTVGKIYEVGAEKFLCINAYNSGSSPQSCYLKL